MTKSTIPNVGPKGPAVTSVITTTIKSSKRDSYLQKSELPFDSYFPWEDPVEFGPLLTEISATIRRYVVLDQDQADTAALWVAHTYLVHIFDTSPIAIIDAPERACAKTLFQTVLARMSYQALSASNATASSLFRSVELWSPTIFFDEADTFFKENQDLHGMVNAGYKKGGFVLRTETIGDSFVPRKFSVYGAKSIAGIGLDRHLPDATRSRGITLKMRRKLPGEKVERMRYAEPRLFEILAAKLTRFAKDYEKAISEARPQLPYELSDRAQDNWEPLLAIAMCAGGDWLDRATAAALKLSATSNEASSSSNELLADIQQIFEQRKDDDKISSKDLIAALIEIEDGAWKTYNHGHPLTPRQLARMLSAYEIKSKTVRMGPFDTPKGYTLNQFEDAFVRYVHPSEPDPASEEAVPREEDVVSPPPSTPIKPEDIY